MYVEVRAEDKVAVLAFSRLFDEFDPLHAGQGNDATQMVR